MKEPAFPSDPCEPFWWAQARCRWCDEREIALSPLGGFVCMACGARHTVDEVRTAADDGV